MKKIIPVLAIVLAVAAVAFVMIVQKKLKEEEPVDNTPQQNVGNAGDTSPSDQNAGTVTRTPVKLGNDDDGISYEGPGTVRDEGMAKPGDANYRLGNQDGAIGLEPIAEFETLTEYSTRMFGGGIPDSLTVTAKGTDTAAALASFDGTNAHLKHTAPDGTVYETYMIRGTLYTGKGKDWEQGEESAIAEGKEFAKLIMDLFSSPNVSGFTHRIESNEKVEHPIEGETVLNFDINMEKAAGLMEKLCSMTGEGYATLTGTLSMEARLDRWGIIEKITVKSGSLGLGEGTYEAKGYVITFSDIDCSGPIYLPGTEPTKAPTAAPEPTQGVGGGSGGSKTSGEPKGNTEGKGKPVKVTDNKTYIYPICELDKDKNTFELADGLTVTYAGTNDDDSSWSEDYVSYFVIRNSSNTDYEVGVSEMSFDTDCFSVSLGTVSTNALIVKAGSQIEHNVYLPSFRRNLNYKDPERTGYLFRASTQSGTKITSERTAFYNHVKDTEIYMNPERASSTQLNEDGTLFLLMSKKNIEDGIGAGAINPKFWEGSGDAGMTVKLCSLLVDENSQTRKFRLTGIDVIAGADKTTMEGEVIAKCTVWEEEGTSKGKTVIPGTGTYYTVLLPKEISETLSGEAEATVLIQGMDVYKAYIEEYDHETNKLIKQHVFYIPTYNLMK